MNVDISTVATFAMTVTGTVVILYGLLLLTKVKNDGELGRLFARAVVDTRTRNTLLWGVSLVSAMFISLGFLRIAEDVGLLSDPVRDLLGSGIFLTGSATLLYLTWMGLGMAKLSLENQLDLRDTEPAVFAALAPAGPDATEGSMYAPYPLEERTGSGGTARFFR